MSTWGVSTLAVATSDTDPSLVLTFDTAKYIFNLGEGSGRVYIHSPNALRNLKAFFVTGVATRHCAGMPGMMMFCADGNVSHLSLVGPHGLAHRLASMRHYLHRSSISVDVAEASYKSIQATDTPSPVFKDENITVYSIPLAPSTETPCSVEVAERPLKRKRSPSPPASSKRGRLQQRASSPSFIPSVLADADADEWRQIMIQEMFPFQQPEPSQDPSTSRKAKKAARDAAVERAAKERAKRLPVRAKLQRLPPFSPGEDSGSPLPTMAYVVVGPSVRGKFDAQKAKELQIPNGPLRRELTTGKSVTFEVDDGDGGKIQRTVHPEEVMGATEMPRTVLILDVPTPAHIPALMTAFTDSPFYAKFRTKDPKVVAEWPVPAVYHLCGEDVLEHDLYKDFMNGFGDETQHVISSRAHTADMINFDRSALCLARLNKLDENMFPIPRYSLEAARELSSVPGLPANILPLEVNLHVQIRPTKPPARDQSKNIFNHLAISGDPVEISERTRKTFGLAQEFVQSRRRPDATPSRLPGGDVVVTTLGTGSAVPTHLRSLSALLVQTPENGSILLDCGEGTWGQIARAFGEDPARKSGAWAVLRDLQCVFLSHMHGDHHMGIAKLLSFRAQMDPPPSGPLYVVGLRQHFLYLLEQAELEDLGLSGPNGVVLVLADALTPATPTPVMWFVSPDLAHFLISSARQRADEMANVLGLDRFQTVFVKHRTRCYGLVMHHKSGWSVCYSSDTMPSEELVRAGKDVTLLIHECTMGTDEEAMAAAKAHSTSKQALDVGHRMGAKNILLTHFSARYPAMPPSFGLRRSRSRSPSPDVDPKRARAPPVGTALDFARIRIGDMWQLESYGDAILAALIESSGEEAGEIDVAALQAAAM
ncbi:uncharacterized protein BXZ73DRAFT_42209 [Epithele typhae]|uniref:uncharacterized protein n=1 Tax=Epithele typhae TaxID=378194 RepID=UPI002007589C|nr:uncharacterized protein BXZ73DRAFT_42209 [Epithele typhae]KAH9941310.1 hypothetical protein BXZ73DRAFT_42209 [Epithele typhae]